MKILEELKSILKIQKTALYQDYHKPAHRLSKKECADIIFKKRSK